jgi:hypothetical protein
MTGNFEYGPCDLRELVPGGTRGKTVWLRRHTVAADPYTTMTMIGNADDGDIGTGVPVVDIDGAAVAVLTLLAAADKWYCVVLGADYPFVIFSTEGGDNANTLEAFIVI